MTVPQAAIDAAIRALRERDDQFGIRLYANERRAVATAILAAAAPHIAAAERERIRQLALRKRAVYCIACDGAPCGYDDILRPFADLLTEPEGTHDD